MYCFCVKYKFNHVTELEVNVFDIHVAHYIIYYEISYLLKLKKVLTLFFHDHEEVLLCQIHDLHMT